MKLLDAICDLLDAVKEHPAACALLPEDIELIADKLARCQLTFEDAERQVRDMLEKASDEINA